MIFEIERLSNHLLHLHLGLVVAVPGEHSEGGEGGEDGEYGQDGDRGEIENEFMQSIKKAPLPYLGTQIMFLSFKGPHIISAPAY